MRAFHVEPNAVKGRRDRGRPTVTRLSSHYTGRLRLSDVKEMFEQMKDHA